MTFVLPILLWGLVLAGVPVVLHLIMQQKPKRLPFAAFRFLVQRHRSNQRRLRLRHLLLLLLRVAALAGLCLALARPKLGDKPAVVLIIDTSPSMDYRSGLGAADKGGRGGNSRLDEARRRALELLDQLPSDAQVAVLDTGEDAGGTWIGPTTARERIQNLRIEPASAGVTGRLADAYRLLGELPPDPSARQEPVRLLAVFSDRTPASWDSGRLGQLQFLRDRLPGKDLRATFIDVGVDKPEGLAVADLQLSRQALAANDRVEIRATLRAVGRDYDTEVMCRIDGDAGERRPIPLKAGNSQVVSWERRGLTAGPHFVEIRLATDDPGLAFASSRTAVFEVGTIRRVLVVCDDAREDGPSRPWRLALEAGSGLRFDTDLMTPAAAAELGHDRLDHYRSICLLDVAKPSHQLWEQLKYFVSRGGGLAVVPGGEELQREAYNGDPIAQELLPATLDRPVFADNPDGVLWRWESADFHQPLVAPFEHWRHEATIDFFKYPRRATSYWATKPTAASVLISYADGDPNRGRADRPAVLERRFDRDQTGIRGRVLLFTTALDGRRPEWNDYLQNLSSFYVVLAKLSVGYLAGDASESNLNHQLTVATSRLGVLVTLPSSPRFPSYTLSKATRPHGPELAGATFVATIPRPADTSELRITQSLEPGTYSLLGSAEGKTWLTGFSLNIPPEESNLTKLPAEHIEALFGPGSILAVGQQLELKEALRSPWRFRVIELFPWLMVAVVFALAIENLLANKFYRKQALEPSATTVRPTSPSVAREPVGTK